MASRMERALSRASSDRQVQIAAASVAAAGAAAVAGKAGLDRLRNGDGDSGPSRAYRLKDKEKVAEGLVRIARGRTDDALEHLDGHGDPAAVHETRKDLKKLRSLLRLLRDDVGKDAFRRENERYREAGRRLSGARDAEVMLETLGALEERYEDGLPDSVAGFREHLERRRGEAEPELEQARTLIAAGRESIEAWAAQGGGWKVLEPGIRRSYRRGRRMLGSVRSSPSEEAVHEWRKRSKDLWYQVRIVKEAWPDLLGDLADETHELSDLLGDHHDLAVLRAEAKANPGCFEGSKDRKRLTGLIEKRQDELLSRALELGDRLYAEKPKDFTQRIGSYWAAWRG
jgi:CHAD domain-containing protein